MHIGHHSRSGSCESLPLSGTTNVLRTNISFTMMFNAMGSEFIYLDLQQK